MTTDAWRWHRWFAWHPIDLNGQWHWLAMVLRRRQMSHHRCSEGSQTWWEYRHDD